MNDINVDRTTLPISPATPPIVTSTDIREQTPSFSFAPPVTPPPGAPNVVVVLLDDMGFGASSAFGGPCDMPVADELAANGLSYTRFHTTGMCSPTRASLLTGRNHHAVSMGYVADQCTPPPGYTARMPASAATIARILTANGYATGAFGKMHQMPRSQGTPVGPFEAWPTKGEGFEKFYGFLGGEINHWVPSLFDGTTAVDPPRTVEEGYHLSEDLVDQAVSWIDDVRSLNPDKPFFCYLPFGATHAPFHVAPAWAEKYKGRFARGWDAQRTETLGKQVEGGIVPKGTELGPWAPGVPHWSELTEEEQQAASSLMELYAGFAEHTDEQVGRLLGALRDRDIADNTLFIYILGDNGASPEGGILGTVNEHRGWNGIPVQAKDILDEREKLGGPDTWPHYSVGWALAMDTPYQWTKQIASHFGGTRNGLIIHWPERIKDRGGLRHQWHHVVDIFPTILSAAGLPAPTSVDGITQQRVDGVPMNYSFEDGDADDRRSTQYFEIAGSRGIYHDGWVACVAHRSTPWDITSSCSPAFEDDRWELYDTRTDWSQSVDLSARFPDRLKKLKDLFLLEGTRNQVFPLDDRPMTVRKNARDRGRIESMTFHGGARRMPSPAVPNVIGSSFELTIQLDAVENASGVLCAQGGKFSGYSLYCTNGLLTFCQNIGGSHLEYIRAKDVLPPGSREVKYAFDYDGGSLGNGGTGSLWVDGKKVGEGRIEKTMQFQFPIGEEFNVGVDPLTPVSTEYTPVHNEFNGRIAWCRLELTGGDGVSLAQQERIEVAVQ